MIKDKYLMYLYFLILIIEFIVFNTVAKIVHNDYTKCVKPIKLPIPILDCEFFHTLLHFSVGIAFPKYHLLSLLAGVIWELLESLYGKYVDKLKVKNNPNMKKYNGDVYWRGSISDNLYNLIGILLANFYLIFFKKTNNYAYAFLILSFVYFLHLYNLVNFDIN